MQNSFDVNKSVASKVESYADGIECMKRLVTKRSDIRIWRRLSILNALI